MNERQAKFSIKGELLYLLPERCIYWPCQKALLLSDLHLGKAGHFRKAGIPVSAQIHLEDLARLSTVLVANPVERVLILGDLFHSEMNREFAAWCSWLDQHQYLQCTLVAGNHDQLTLQELSEVMEVKEVEYVGPFALVHNPLEVKLKAGYYPISGHLHPGITLSGKGRQSLSLPCFYFGKNGGVLPAFGNFTGLHRLRPAKGDQVFAITKEKVYSFSGLFER
ncbi:ligase-associated DNA damage response endonuclease PdeM [Rapidithrix thailandica]|uniref:Ligase-associated DNA damage response endonuclease PdeM n=1 Tax=Rapidithrix thailandica TaxID=413964 RepID=A0AAW9RYD1_9BACT